MIRYTHENLKQLVLAQQSPCISVYFDLKAPFWAPKNITRFRRLLKEAESELLTQCGKLDSFRLLSQLKMFAHLQKNFRNAQTVCFFISNSTAGYFPVAEPLERRVVVAKSFHIKPLLPYMNPSDGWLFVHLKDNAIEFFKCQGPIIGNVSKRTSLERFAIRKSANEICDLINNWVTCQRTASNEPVFIVGKQNTLDSLPLTDSSKLVFCFTDCPQALTLVTQAALAYLDGRAHSRLFEVKHAPVVKEHVVDKIISRISSNEIDLLFLKRNKTSWGRIDCERGSVRRSTTGLMHDCIFDDLAEHALAKNVSLFMTDDKEFPKDVDALAVVKSKTSSVWLRAFK